VWGNYSGGGLTTSYNTYCDSSLGNWPAGTNATYSCSPGFAATGSDDYRIVGSDRGIDWSPASQTYGP
jgi:hypothetical protein